jgi:hypothetical protein
MNAVKRIALGLLVVALLAAGTPASADRGPIVRFESQSELELDLAMMVEDLLPVLLGLEEAENEAWPEQAQSILELIGIPALDRLHVRSSTSARESRSRITLTLDPEAEGGFLAALSQVPPGRFRFGEYLDAGEAAAVVSFQNFSQGLKTLVELVAEAEIQELAPYVSMGADGTVSAWGVNLHQEVFPHLQGELDFILFPFRPGEKPRGPNVALVLGTPDGPALRESLLGLVGKVAGADKEAELRGIPGENAGTFTFYPLSEKQFYGVGSKFLLVTTDVERVKGMVARPRRGIRAPQGRQYVRLDGDLLLDIVADLAEAGGPGAKEEKLRAEILRAVGEEPIGVIEIMSESRPHRIEMEIRQPSSILDLQYRVFKELLVHAGEFQALEEERGEYVKMVAEVDEAMTRYGQDHDGMFPETPQDLVGEGYLKAFPDLTPTPLGRYVEGGYTYVPLRDDEGTVVGYYLFVYGGGEGTGHDVFTPENVTDPEGFRIEADGTPDGVPSFCYDGIAIPRVEAWTKER